MASSRPTHHKKCSQTSHVSGTALRPPFHVIIETHGSAALGQVSSSVSALTCWLHTSHKKSKTVQSSKPHKATTLSLAARQSEANVLKLKTRFMTRNFTMLGSFPFRSHFADMSEVELEPCYTTFPRRRSPAQRILVHSTCAMVHDSKMLQKFNI